MKSRVGGEIVVAVSPPIASLELLTFEFLQISPEIFHIILSDGSMLDIDAMVCLHVLAVENRIVALCQSGQGFDCFIPEMVRVLNNSADYIAILDSLKGLFIFIKAHHLYLLQLFFCLYAFQHCRWFISP